MIQQVIDSIIGGWQTLNLWVDSFLARIATLSLQELLAWMLIVFLVLAVSVGVLKASATVMEYIVKIMAKVLKVLMVLVPLFLVAFWALSNQRPCTFNGEHAFTGCVSAEELAKRQQQKK